MRNQMRVLKRLGTLAALLTAMLLVSSASAAAATWSPTGVTATGALTTGGVSFDLPTGVYVDCLASSMTLTTIGGQYAVTPTNNPPTFSNCLGGPGTQILKPVASGQWIVRADSTSTTTIRLPSGGLKLVAGSPAVCTITIGPGQIDVPAQWSNVTHRLRVNFAQVPYTVTGPTFWCGGQSSGQLTIHTQSGWLFSGLSIV
jgi:hypothetical protein